MESFTTSPASTETPSALMSETLLNFDGSVEEMVDGRRRTEMLASFGREGCELSALSIAEPNSPAPRTRTDMLAALAVTVGNVARRDSLNVRFTAGN